MARISVTLSLDEDNYNLFQELCDKKAYALSRKIDLFIEEELKKEGIIKREDGGDTTKD